MPKKGYSYQGEGKVCPLCGQEFRTSSGLVGHLRFKHGLAAQPGEVDSLESTEPTVSRLKTDIEKITLTRKLAALNNEPAGKPSDLAQEAGLGSMTPSVKEVVQGRAFNVEQPKSSVAGELKDFAQAVAAIKGLFPGNDNQGNNNISSLLSLLGYSSLKDLFQAVQAPKIEAGSSIGGINLSGMTATPEIVIALLKLEGEKLTAAANIKVGEDRARLVEDAVKKITAAVGAGLADRAKGVGAAAKGYHVDVEGDLEGEYDVPCPGCGNPILCVADATELICDQCGQRIAVKRTPGKKEPSIGDHIKKGEGS